MKIKTFDRDNLQDLRKDINEALQLIALQYGIKTSGIGNIRFSSSNFSTKFEFVVDEVVPARSENLQDYVGRKFRHGRRVFSVYMVQGDRFRASSNTSNKTFLITLDQIINMVEVK